MSLLLLANLPAQQPTFRAATELVRLEVVVRDADGRLVTGLSQEDFDVRDTGRSQQVEVFRQVVVPAGRRDLAQTVTRPRVDIATNSAPDETRAAVSIVVDDGSLEPGQVVPTKRVLRQLLEGFSDNDLVSLTFVGRSDLGRDFTTDAHSLINAIDGVTESLGSPATIAMLGGIRSTNDRDVYLVLTNVIKTLASAREARRLVVYVSRGTMEGRSPGRLAYSVWNSLFDSARREGIRVYAVDPGGLLAPELGLDASYEQQNPSTRTVFSDKRKAGQRFLIELADNTGGLAFVDRWDLNQATQDVITDTSSYYLLGYRPQLASGGRQVRPVEIKMRQPGLRAFARSGYLADRLVKPLSPVEGLREALAAGLPGGTMPVEAFAVPIGRMGDGVRYVAGVAFSAAGEAGDYLLSGIAVDADGKVIGSWRQSTAVESSAQSTTVLLPIDITRHATVLRIAVASPSGALGTVHLQIADLQRLAYREQWTIMPPLLAAGPVANVVVPAPMPFPDRFVPTVSRTFAGDASVQVLTRVVGADLDSLSLDVVVRGSGVERTSALRRITGLTSSDVIGSVDMRGLPAGDYALEVRATAATGMQQIRSVAIRVQ